MTDTLGCWGWGSVKPRLDADVAEMRPIMEVLQATQKVPLTRPSPLLSSRPRARQNGGKVRHKRQALQDMARPLKQWLYKHRDNPYPTKTEKILLALGSQMTLVQVIQTPQTGVPSPR